MSDTAPCDACGEPIDLTANHIALLIQVERQDQAGDVHVGAVTMLGRWHPEHAKWRPDMAAIEARLREQPPPPVQCDRCLPGLNGERIDVRQIHQQPCEHVASEPR